MLKVFEIVARNSVFALTRFCELDSSILTCGSAQCERQTSVLSVRDVLKNLSLDDNTFSTPGL